MSLETMTKIATITVGSGGVSSVTFSSIPQTYTDLVIKYSSRTSDAAIDVDVAIRFNSDSASNYPVKRLYGNSGAAYSDGATTTSDNSRAVGATATANTFANGEIYIPNYTSSNAKSLSVDTVGENNSSSAGAAYQFLIANLWTGTSPITSISLLANFVQYSTFTLYGVKALRTAITPSVGLRASGGTVTQSGGYVYHTFLSSGMFTPKVPGSFEVLAVAGGGGPGSTPGVSGAGGGGGLLYSPALSLDGSVAVIVGAGGAVGSSPGTSTTIGSLVAYGGGPGGNARGANAPTGTYGSGGGGSDNPGGSNTSGAAGTTGQGNTGGAGIGEAPGAGGGAGGAASGNIAGASSSAYSTWGDLSTRQSGNLAGGGYAEDYSLYVLTNTGWGGNGAVNPGGSGIVVIRYVA